MPRKPDLDPPVHLKTSLPESVRTRLDLLLFSEIEGRVPKGAYQDFFLQRIQEFFTWRKLDLGGGRFVAGPPESIDYIKELLDVKPR